MGLGQSDFELLLSDGQLVTTTAISDEVYDTGPFTAGNTGIDLGALGKLWLMVMVRGDVTASGNATVTFTLESDDVATLDDSPTVHWSSVAYGKAILVDNYVVYKGPVPSDTYQAHVGVRYTVATGPLTSVSAFTAVLGTQPYILKQHAHALDFA